MLSQNLFDVIIIGSGPAGATLASELADSGINVLVLEKAGLPRYKCCGGGITFKTARLLSPGIHHVFLNTIYGLTLSFSGHCLFDKVAEQPLIYTVKRDEFDYALTLQAQAAGAVVLPNNGVTKIMVGDDFIEVNAGSVTFRSRFVVGADGANGITAKALGFPLPGSRIIAVESEIRVTAAEMAKWQSRILLELGRVTAGYAWVFPRQDHLSIGIGCFPRYAKNLRRHYNEFLASLNLENPAVLRFGSAFIPVCSGKLAAVRGRAILIGDAAGLSDPLTGEGIYNALVSAHLAAIAIRNAIATQSTDLKEYGYLLEQQIVPEMKIAGTYAKLLTIVPRRLFNMVQDDARVWRGCRQLLRGERNYAAVKNRLDIFGGMYSFVFHR